MLLKIKYLANDPTVVFAAKELKRYLSQMDDSLMIALSRQDTYQAPDADTIWLGIGIGIGPAQKLPPVADPTRDDALLIDITGRCGVITANNARSVLLAVYRYLRELGCAWVRPGQSGEIIPTICLTQTSANVCEAASYRHRGICIEGAVAYEHVLNMIEWLPKVGMNSYFTQFHVPFEFFRRWYTHQRNPLLETENVGVDDVVGMVEDLVDEIKLRGMLYHATGHGWTCEPFGIEGNGWTKVSDDMIPEESRQFIAELNGKRAFYGGVPLNTNMCYGNDEVRERMTNAITQYCRENPAVDYLHFWLADASNNHCECPLCKDITPSDIYVRMLNELDKKLTEQGIETRIVFLIYQELLWAPETERIQNPDRFVLMFAPISRTYSTAYADADMSAPVTLAPYERNKIAMPRDVNVNVARLKSWQDQIDGGDSFIFDYHFMWDHLRDPGYNEIAKVLFADMKNLDNIGLNGMISCQVQRAFFPTGLGMTLMADALWDKEADYEAAAKAYFSKAYATDGHLAYHYLDRLSTLFDPPYLRHEKPRIDAKKVEDFKSILTLLDEFTPTITRNMNPYNQPCPGVRRSWELLSLHAQLCRILAKGLILRASGANEEIEEVWQTAASFTRIHEMDLHEVFDVQNFIRVCKGFLFGDIEQGII